MRSIRTYGDGISSAVADVLEGILASEVLNPSKELWFVWPWVRDVPVIDNTQGRLAGIDGALPHRPLRLMEVIEQILQTPTTRITLVMRETDNQIVLERARQLDAAFENFRLVLSPTIHEKALVTDRVVLRGSMNLTVSGTKYNQESITVDSDPRQVVQSHLELKDRHGGHA